ncbi:MAG: superoxide dismutase family protein, partial [Rhodococcus sp. (in: high G+C Gram-positive bacteria)]
GLTACSNSEEASTEPGTTPPVWTGSAAPASEAHGDDQGTEGGSESPAGGAAAASAAALTAELTTVDGASAGTVSFAENGGDVEVTIEVEGLEPGYHGVHIHEFGRCEAESTAPDGGEPGAFLSAGAHLQAGGNTSVPESGDLVSLVVHEDGTATATVTTSAFGLEDLEGEDGASVVVHQDNLGARLACGVIG